MRFLLALVIISCFSFMAFVPAVDLDVSNMETVVSVNLPEVSPDESDLPTDSVLPKDSGLPSQAKGGISSSLISKLPLQFIENKGQTDEEVRYVLHGVDKTLYFTSSGITFHLENKLGNLNNKLNASRDSMELGPETPATWALRLDFAGADHVEPEGLCKSETTFNYFRGKREDWHTRVPAFNKIAYRNLWPGIDLIYSLFHQQLKYEFVVHPNADPDHIRLACHGATGVSMTKDGGLEIKTPFDTLEDDRPVTYQNVKNDKIEIPARFKLEEQADKGDTLIGFDIGSYDSSLPLIIDPSMLIYCGYIGGNEDDTGYAVAVDDEGCAYFTGQTKSAQGTFPVVVGPGLVLHPGGTWVFDTFVAKLNAEGTTLIYCGYIGGDNSDSGYDIAVDDEGCAYVTGVTDSSETEDFPITVGPDLTYNEEGDAFIAKVSSTGEDLEYCGYLGGHDREYGLGIALDDTGSAFIAGYTRSDESRFPVKVGPDLSFNSSGDEYDGFIAKVKPDGSGVDYCGYIGGEFEDMVSGIAVDGANCAYLTGYTESDESTFPVKIGPDLTYNGGGWENDAFVAKVNAQGTELVYCGYIGGVYKDEGTNIAVDAMGCAYVLGETDSIETGFPLKAGPDLTYNGLIDGFIAKVAADGMELEYCGYIGGEEDDWFTDIAVDHRGCAYFSGWTKSLEDTFPVIVGPFLKLTRTTSYYSCDAFIGKVNPTGTGLSYCGYIGGEDYECAYGLALDASNHVYLTGVTRSTEDDQFPVTVGPDLTFNGDVYDVDAFVAKVAIPLSADQYFLETQGSTIHMELRAGDTHGHRKYIMIGGVTGSEPGYPLPGGHVTLPVNFDDFTYYINFPLILSSVFDNFIGMLGEHGEADARLVWPGPALPPGAVGLTLTFAYCLNAPYDYASNPIQIEIIR